METIREQVTGALAQMNDLEIKKGVGNYSDSNA